MEGGLHMESISTRRSAVVAVLMMIALLCSAPGAQAAEGDLDPTFGTGGRVFTDFGSGDGAFAVAYQADGKVVAAGSSDAAGTFDFALARYNADGSLDTGFGSGGKVLTDLGSSFWDVALAVAIQSDGKIVAAGFGRASNGYDPEIALVRYNPDGSLDTGFGAGGKVQTGFASGVGYSSLAEAIVLQPDGKIVVAGSSWFGTSRFTLVRYNTDGTLDTGFGTGGIALADVGYGEARSVALQPDGRIVAAGFSYLGGGRNFTLVRLNSDGGLDSTFGDAGVAFTDFGGASLAYAVAIQLDGKIVATGLNDVDGYSDIDFALARYQTDGSLDTSFDSDGKVLTDVNSQSSDEARAVVIQSDGKILIAGNASGVQGGFAILRYNADGTLDTTFDGDGKVLPGGGRLSAAAVPVQPDGRIVVAGDSLGDFALVRLITIEKGAQEQVADLIALVDSYQLDKLGTSLHDKLVTVQRMLANDKPKQACENLDNFLNQVRTQTGKGLTVAQADELTARAQRVRDEIGC